MNDRTGNLLGALAIALTDAIRASTEAASGQNLTGAAALATVIAYPAETIDALARTIGISSAGASRLVDKLEDEGLVRRESSRSDARSRVIVATEAGHETAKRVLKARSTAIARALEALSDDQCGQLTILLEGMLGGLTVDRETCDRTCRLCDISACPQDICPVEVAALAREPRS